MRGFTIGSMVALTTVALTTVTTSVRAADRDIYIASRDTDSIKRYDGETGAYLGDFVSPGSGGLDQPQECLFGPGDDLYVSGFQNSEVLRYDGVTGDFMGPFTSGYSLSQPAKVMYGPDGHMYVSQWGGSEKIARFDRFTGVFIDEFTEITVINNCGMAWDVAGNLYLAYWGSDGETGGVWKFGPDGSDLGQIIGSNVRGPVNVWFGDDGDFYVLDWTEGSVEHFDGTTFAYVGRTISNLTRAEGFVFDDSGRLYICDWQLNRVAWYEPDGTFIGIFASGGGMIRPNSITFGPESVVSVGEPTTTPIVKLGVPQPNPFRPSTRFDVTLESPARVMVSVFDTAGRRVTVLSDGHLTRGVHGFSWDATRTAAGVYFVRIDTGDASAVRRVTRLR